MFGKIYQYFKYHRDFARYEDSRLHYFKIQDDFNVAINFSVYWDTLYNQ